VLVERHLTRQLVDYGYEIAPDVRPAEAIVPGPEMRCRRTARDVDGDQRAVQVWVRLLVELRSNPRRPTQSRSSDMPRGTTGDHCSVYCRARRRVRPDAQHPRPSAGMALADRAFPGRPAPPWKEMLSHLRLDLFNGTTTPERARSAGSESWRDDPGGGAVDDARPGSRTSAGSRLDRWPRCGKAQRPLATRKASRASPPRSGVIQHAVTQAEGGRGAQDRELGDRPVLARRAGGWLSTRSCS